MTKVSKGYAARFPP